MTSCEVAIAARPMASQAIDWATVWFTIEPRVRAVVAASAASRGLSERDLLISSRLHLPRFRLDELESATMLQNEVERIAVKMTRARSRFLEPSMQRANCFLKRDTANFAPVELETARVIHERFHYVGSFRDGLHFGLFDKCSTGSSGFPIAMATLSVLDVKHLQSLAENSVGSAAAMILSRVYCFDHAWHNSISHLLGRVVNWLRTNRPEIRALYTYVNPNLGFSGVSYRASNWEQAGEKSISYRYIDGDYASARQCEGAGGVWRVVSRAPYYLLPLSIWSYIISD